MDFMARALALSKDGFDFMHNKEKGLMQWRAARSKALAGVGPKATVVLFGDSIAEGTGSSDHYSKSFAALLRNYFRSAPFNETGVGFVPAHYSTSASAQWMTFTGSWIDDGTYGVAKRAKRTSTAGDKATFKFTGTSVDVWYVKRPGGGSFQVSVDGGAATTIYTNTSGAASYAKQYLSGFAAGVEHTVTITVAGGVAGMVTIAGYCPYVGATYGVQFNLMSKFGSVLSDHVDDNVIGFEVDSYFPTLSIIALMANDSGVQTSLADYRSRMQKLIDRCKGFGDVLLVSTGLRGINYAIPQKAYNDAMKDLAYKNNAAFLDIFNAWSGDYNWQKGHLGLIVGAGDDVHPNDAGHRDIFDRIVKILS